MALFGRPSEADNARELAYRAWYQRQNPLALAALIFSVFSLTHFGTLWVDGIAGIVMGAVALRQIGRAHNKFGDDPPWFARPGGRGLAWAGIAVGCLSLALAFVVYFGFPAS